MDNKPSLNEALGELMEFTLVSFLEALETLLIYTKNLAEFPGDPKYYKILYTNCHFQERIGWMEPGCLNVFKAIGFNKIGDNLVFNQNGELEEPEIVQEMSQIANILQEAYDKAKEEFNCLPERIDLNTHKFSSVEGVGFYSDIGKRPTMEDDELIVDKCFGDDNSGFFAIFDGHGGRATVDFVVKSIYINFEEYVGLHPDHSFDVALRESFLTTDAQVRRNNILQSGCTAAVCYLTKDKETGTKVIHSVNVGDTRSVLMRKDSVRRITIDHKPTNADEEKRVKDAGGFISSKRVNGVLAVSRALGDHMLKFGDVVTAIPYYEFIPIDDSVEFLIQACDGVWDVLSEETVGEVIRSCMKKFNNESGGELNNFLSEICKAIVDLALEKKSQDNITCMVVKL